MAPSVASAQAHTGGRASKTERIKHEHQHELLNRTTRTVKSEPTDRIKTERSDGITRSVKLEILEPQQRSRYTRYKRNPFIAPPPFSGQGKSSDTDELPYSDWKSQMSTYLTYDRLIPDMGRFTSSAEVFTAMDDSWGDHFLRQRKRSEFGALQQDDNEGFSDFCATFDAYLPYLDLKDDRKKEELRDKLNATCAAEIRGKRFNTLNEMRDQLRVFEVEHREKHQHQH
ncbi:uncharacterized protein MYCGRDRAFT_97901 [Zymoseptoria tritici IPO323]|uniref:Retrotransposon gag domain-containing protein n=1 Tax=Zymoseptoria tritici (strain CBS 115943 / IPO323) TaxID=336722 RepID=F9XRQ5_ZYMTI|nr:uncharacterized protein MYCGRDRAFT_97901 [Zymoseptoria tritici IPO323]EGP82077.1 hypothetical protein MYCGRDRAFT_97901 [Zymoseptoria tritici IPO323]